MKRTSPRQKRLLCAALACGLAVAHSQEAPQTGESSSTTSVPIEQAPSAANASGTTPPSVADPVQPLPDVPAEHEVPPAAMSPELSPLLDPDQNTPAGDNNFFVDPQINLAEPDAKYPLVSPLQPGADATQSYPVLTFNFKYAPEGREDKVKLPTLESLTKDPVTLGKTPTGFTAAGKGTEDAPVQLGTLPAKADFSPDALREIFAALQKRLNEQGIYGVLVSADPKEIDVDDSQDKRKNSPAPENLTVLIYVGEIVEVRTVSKRPAFRETAPPTINDPHFVKVKAKSPLQPGSLLNKDQLENYLTRVNRFPGRRVDVAVNASGEPGGVILDYLVREAKPWTVFLQTSNTGTESTGEYRTQLGAEYRQLAKLDDILTLDYTTSDLDSSNNLNASYQVTPLFPDLLKAKIYGSYGKFTASDVGFDFQQFEGESWRVGGLLTWTPLYFKNCPLDITLGAEWVDVEVSNQSFGGDGHGEFLMPYLGLGTEKKSDTWSFYANTRVITNLPSFTNTSEEDLGALGRFQTDNDFYILQFSLGTSFYLEPLLLGKKFRTPNDPKSWTLAHEFVFTGRGQYTFDDQRLIPQFEDTIGGFYTVRGYPESLAAGDDIYVGSAEYRLHLPRLLSPWKAPEGSASDARQQIGKFPFALQPKVTGEGVEVPDWDLIFRLFADAGYNKNNRLQPSSEVNRTLVGVGAGLELQIKNNFSVRVDLGIALQEQRDLLVEQVNEGDTRIHVAAALVW